MKIRNHLPRLGERILFLAPNYRPAGPGTPRSRDQLLLFGREYIWTKRK